MWSAICTTGTPPITRFSYTAVLKIFYQEFVRKATVLVIPTVLEIFYQEFVRKATVLVIPTVLEIFYQEFGRKATAVLFIPTALL